MSATVVLPMTGRLLRRNLAWLLALLTLVVVFELLQPVVADSVGGPGGMGALLEALPPAFQAFIRTTPELIVASGLAGSLSLGFTHPIFLVPSAAAVIGFVARALAGEMERGTIQIPLSRPISRSRVYGARVLGVVVITLGLAVAGPLGMSAGLALVQPEGEFVYRHLVPTAVAAALLFWAIGGLTLLGSAAAGSTSQAVGWAMVTLVVFYFVDSFAVLWDILKPLEPFSIFDYYDPAQALVNGALPASNVVVLLAVGLAGTLGGLLIFTRRDLPT